MKKFLLFMPVFGNDGFKTFSQYFIKYFANKGYNLEIYTLFNSIPRNQNSGSLILRIRLFYQIFQKIYRRFKKSNFDVIIALGHRQAFIILVSRILLGYKFKVIVVVQDSTLYESTQFLKFIIKYGKWFKYYMTFHLADKVITATKGIEHELCRVYRLQESKCKHIYNCISVDYIVNKSTLDDSLTKDDIMRLMKVRGSINVVSIGRLTAQKNYANLVTAAAKVINKNRNVHFYIIGSGKQYNLLLRMVIAYKITSNVHFVGAKANPFVYLRWADIYVQSSIYEGFGYSMVEAMALGKPVVSTDCPYGPGEILGDGEFGLLVPMRDSRTLAKALLDLVRDKKLRKKLESKAFIRSKYFDCSKQLSKYKILLDSM